MTFFRLMYVTQTLDTSSMESCCFSVTSNLRQKLIRTDIGTQFYLTNIRERDRYASPGVLIWTCNMMNSWTELQMFDRHTVTEYCCCQQLILSRRLFGAAISTDLFSWTVTPGDIRLNHIGVLDIVI